MTLWTIPATEQRDGASAGLSEGLWVAGGRVRRMALSRRGLATNEGVVWLQNRHLTPRRDQSNSARIDPRVSFLVVL